MMHQAWDSVNALQGKLRNQFIDEATRTAALLSIGEIGPWVRLAQECGLHLHGDHQKVTQLEEVITLCFDTHRILVCRYADDGYR